MITTPEIVETADRTTAIIHLTIPRDEIQQVMGPGISGVMATLAAQGIAPAGPWFTHHLRMEPDIFDFEISVPVSTPVLASGRVKPGRWPAMRVARAVLHGGYEGLGAAWGEFDAWIAANGYTPGPDVWECYVVGPEANPDPSAWRTELSRRLIG